MQQSFITNNQVRPDLTLFNSAESKAVFGNLLTLPIGGNGLLYVEPLYVQGTGQNSFPLLQKVLVNYGDRVGYANTLAEALDQVFGAGAGIRRGRQRVQRGRTPTTSPTSSPPSSAAPTTSPPSGGSGAANPALTQAVSAINTALDGLATAQRNGDFAGDRQGRGRPAEGRSGLSRRPTSAASSRPPRRGEPGRRGCGRLPARLVGWGHRRGVEQLGSSLGS